MIKKRGFTTHKEMSDIRIVVKASDETLNNNNVAQNDDELFFAVNANEVWHISLFLRYTSASGAPAIKTQWTIPVGASIARNMCGLEQNGAADADGTVAYAIVTGVGDTRTFRKDYLYIGGVNGGTVQFQWAQNNATVEDTTVKANSHIRAIKLTT